MTQQKQLVSEETRKAAEEMFSRLKDERLETCGWFRRRAQKKNPEETPTEK